MLLLPTLLAHRAHSRRHDGDRVLLVDAALLFIIVGRSGGAIYCSRLSNVPMYLFYICPHILSLIPVHLPQICLDAGAVAIFLRANAREKATTRRIVLPRSPLLIRGATVVVYLHSVSLIVLMSAF